MKHFVVKTKKGPIVCQDYKGETTFMTITGDFVSNKKEAHFFNDWYMADFCARQFSMPRIRTKDN